MGHTGDGWFMRCCCEGFMYCCGCQAVCWAIVVSMVVCGRLHCLIRKKWKPLIKPMLCLCNQGAQSTVHVGRVFRKIQLQMFENLQRATETDIWVPSTATPTCAFLSPGLSLFFLSSLWSLSTLWHLLKTPAAFSISLLHGWSLCGHHCCMHACIKCRVPPLLCVVSNASYTEFVLLPYSISVELYSWRKGEEVTRRSGHATPSPKN